MTRHLGENSSLLKAYCYEFISEINLAPFLENHKEILCHIS